MGLIDSSYGGTPVAAWTSMGALGADASLMPVFAEWAEFSADQADVPRMIAAEKREDAAAKAAGGPAPQISLAPEP